MIEAIISEVKEAEDKASEIILNANQKSKQMVLDAEINADLERKKVVAEVKEDFRKVVQKAEDKAQIEREKILADGKKNATEFYEEKKQLVNELANGLVDELLKKF